MLFNVKAVYSRVRLSYIYFSGFLISSSRRKTLGMNVAMVLHYRYWRLVIKESTKHFGESKIPQILYSAKEVPPPPPTGNKGFHQSKSMLKGYFYRQWLHSDWVASRPYMFAPFHGRITYRGNNMMLTNSQSMSTKQVDYNSNHDLTT